MKLQEAEINKFMPKGWVMVPTCNGTGTIYDCMDGDGPAYEREMHRAAFTIHASYRRIEELEQEVKDLREAYEDKVRVTREISDLIDPVAAGGATTPALIDVQAQLQRDLPLLVWAARRCMGLAALTRNGGGEQFQTRLQGILDRYNHIPEG